jgi:hypothetical protein
MTAKKSACVVGLALVVLAGSCAAGLAQLRPWPTDPPPRAPGQAPWPGEAQPAQPMVQPAQPMALPAPTGPMMGGAPAMGGAPMMGGPNAAQQACIQDFGKHREEVEKRALAAKAASEKKATREEMCTLVTAYSAAEAKWIKFSEDNMAKCGIPKEAVNQIKGVHVHTADARKKICASGPQAGAPSAPSLSDALGTARLPAPAAEKPKAGMLDTLTGNALAR